MPRLDVPMATTSPPRIGCPHAPSVARVAAGMSLTTGRENRCRTRTIFGSAIALIYDDAGAKSSLKCPFPLDFCRPGPVYVDRSNGPTPVPASDGLPRDAPLPRRLRIAQRPAAARPPGRRALPSRRAGPRAESLRGRAQPVQGDRGPPPGFLLRAARALPHRRDLLPRGRVRQGGQGVRGVPRLLPAAPDRRSRPVPSRGELL